MDKWEYKVLEWPDRTEENSLEQILNDLGKQGWETMGIGGWGWGWGNSEGYKDHGTAIGYTIILKRKLAQFLVLRVQKSPQLQRAPLCIPIDTKGTLRTPIDTEGTPLYSHKIIFSSYEAFSDLRRVYFQLVPIHQPLLKIELE